MPHPLTGRRDLDVAQETWRIHFGDVVVGSIAAMRRQPPRFTPLWKWYQKSIIRHVNSCFETVFGKTGQPRYVALAPTITDGSYPVPCVTRFTIKVATEGRIYADMLRDIEAEKVADILRLDIVAPTTASGPSL
jgi:hypothetical protein